MTTRPLLEISKLRKTRTIHLVEVTGAGPNEEALKAIVNAFKAEAMESLDRLHMRGKAKARNGKRQPRY